MHMHTWHTIISTFWWWIYQKDEVSIEKSEWVSLIEGWMTTCCLHCTLSKFWVFLVDFFILHLVWPSFSIISKHDHPHPHPLFLPLCFIISGLISLPLPSSLGWLYKKFDSYFIGLEKIQPIRWFYVYIFYQVYSHYFKSHPNIYI